MLTNFVTKAFRSFFEVILWVILGGCALLGLIGGIAADSFLLGIFGLIGGTIVGAIFIVIFGGLTAAFLEMSKNVESMNNRLNEVLKTQSPAAGVNNSSEQFHGSSGGN